MSLLEVKNLRIEYPSRYGVLAAVKDLSFSVEKGEIVGVVGESGAGKSTIGNAVIDLLSPPGRIARGDIYLNGELISGKSQNEMRAIRGSRIGFIFQDPMTSLNPLFTVEQQLVETILANTDLSREAAFAKALELMGAVGIPNPDVRIKQYPHQFSGGMRQRVVIAIALSGDPELIIADEPTTALDVSIQDQILQLIRNLCKERQVGCMLVTHDMGVVSNVTDKVAVMYRGDLVEFGTTEQVLGRPNHPYTRSLISAVPRSDVKLVRFPLVSYIEDAGAADTSIDLKTHWLGQSQDERTYEGALLRVENVDLKFVTKDSIFPSRRQYVRACNNISFEIFEGETFGLVGESGSGKSTIARAITGLYPPDTGKIVFEGIDLTALKGEHERRPLRRQMQMVFQNPYSSMNPRMKVRDIIADPLPPPRRERAADRADRRGPAGSRGPGPRRRGQVSPRVLRWPAPAHLHCPRPGDPPALPHLRRAHLGAGCLGAGPDPQPAQRLATGAWAHHAVHQSRSAGHPSDVRPHRCDAARSSGGSGRDRETVHQCRA